jgi:DNA-binding NtrC family response regulator
MPVATDLDGARVLIVEDEFLIADDLVRSLKNAGGVPVGPVGTLEEAEELVRDQEVDAAIVDLNLRGTMAFDFVKRLAAADLPCLIVSGYGPDALPESISGLSRLEKPVSPASVVQALGRALTRVD